MTSAADRGTDRIAWAHASMPALSAAMRDAERSGSLVGLRVGIALTLEPKTASLALAVSGLGASVAVYCSGHSTHADAAAGLAVAGIHVFAEAGADADRDAELLDAFIDFAPELLIDDGAAVTRYIHAERADALGSLRGVAEETTSGVRPLRVMAASGALQVPCLAVNDAPAKLLFDNGYGTGQSVVMAILDVTNTQMPGKHVVVMGYGPVGAGIARCARALGARVTVTEIDPIAALRALHDGHGVATWHEAAGSADVVVTATGIGRTLTAAHLADVKDGAIVAVGGAGPPELDLSLGPAVEDLGEVRPRIRAHRIGVTTFFVLADGECVNCAAAEGNPIEIMDLSLALQLHALDHLARYSDSMEPGVHELSHEISERVAVAQLSAAGRSIDQPTVDQVRATASW